MKNRSFLALIVASISLAACGGEVKETLGLKREVPDEFAVEKRPQLDVPPEFKLRPPVAGAEARGTKKIRDAARAELFGTTTTTNNLSDGGAESVILQKTGAANANADIRQILKDDYADKDESLLESIEKIGEARDKTLVDAEKERERIAQNKKEGKAVSEGETPTKSKYDDLSVLEKIIGE